MIPAQKPNLARRLPQILSLGVAAIAALAITHTASAQLGTWTADTAFPGSAGTVISGSGSSLSFTAGSATASTGMVAPFSPITLTLGQTITFTGQATFGSLTALGNIQVRFGIFDTSTPAVSTSYKGYLAEIPNNAVGEVNGVIGVGNWASNTNNTALTITSGPSNTAGDALASGTTAEPFTFTISVTDNGSNSNTVKALLTSSNGTTYTWQETGTDSATAADANTVYNEVGFFMGNNTAANTVNLSNLSVSIGAVPEPATVGLVVAGAGMLLTLRRRRR